MAASPGRRTRRGVVGRFEARSATRYARRWDAPPSKPSGRGFILIALRAQRNVRRVVIVTRPNVGGCEVSSALPNQVFSFASVGPLRIMRVWAGACAPASRVNFPLPSRENAMTKQASSASPPVVRDAEDLNPFHIAARQFDRAAAFMPQLKAGLIEFLKRPARTVIV